VAQDLLIDASRVKTVTTALDTVAETTVRRSNIYKECLHDSRDSNLALD